MEDKLTDEEVALFSAIKSKNEYLVEKIIETEENSVDSGNKPRIRNTAQDSQGNTFCHYASKADVSKIIELVLSSKLNFVYHVENKKGELPEDLSRNGKFKAELEDQKLLKQHLKRVESIKNQEIQKGGYQKGIIFTLNFALICKSKKNPEKDCLIKDFSEPENFSIHNRQALDEAVAANRWHFNRDIKKREEWLESPPSEFTGENYLLANIGFVMGIQRYNKSSTIIKRQFYSIPIYFSPEAQALLTYYHRPDTNGHSEINLYDLLLQTNNLTYVLNYFRQTFKLEPQEIRKLYACIVDLHSSQDVCDSCELATYEFEQRLIEQLNTIGPSVHFEISKTCRAVVRVSSVHWPTHSEFRKPHHHRQTKFSDTYKDYVARTYDHDQLMDIRKSETFMLHDLRERTIWYKKETIFKTTITQIPPRTLFFVTKTGKPHDNQTFPGEYDIRNDEGLFKLKKT